MGKKLELKGKRFGRLVVLEEAGKSRCGQTLWLCECDCGIKKDILGHNLSTGATKSCGCLRKEFYLNQRGEGNSFYGKKHSVETKNKISITNTGKGHPMYGEHRSTITKEKISISNMGKNHPNYKGGVKKLNLPLYNTYVNKFPKDFEEIRPVMENGLLLLKVRCHNSSCKKWFRPTRIQVRNRLQSFNGTKPGESSFYCSDECKKACSTYGQITWPKGENPNKQNLPYTNDEYLLYRKTIMERENYICEYCGAPATDVHHEKPKKTNPMLALDPDYGHACCEGCHYKYGHKTGTECSTGNLARKIC